MKKCDYCEHEFENLPVEERFCCKTHKEAYLVRQTDHIMCCECGKILVSEIQTRHTMSCSGLTRARYQERHTHTRSYSSHKRASEGQKKRFTNPIEYNKHCEREKEAQNRPEVIEKKRTKELGRKHTKERIENNRKAQNRSEVNEKRVKTLRKTTSKIEWHNEACKRQKEIQNRLEVNTKRIVSLTGRKDSEETKKHKKEAQNRADVILRKSVAATLQMSTLEARKRHSEWMSLAIAEGRFDTYSKIRGYFQTKQNEQVYFASSYELRRFLQLEESNIEFKRYHGVRIPYYFNGNHNYTPDLLRVADCTFEEVKPKGEARDPINVAKWDAARAFCEESKVYKFETVFEDVIFCDISYVEFLKSMLVSPLRNRVKITEEVETRIRANCGLVLKKAA